MTQFNPKTHIVGKVYDLTQENMNAMIKEIELLSKAAHFMKFALLHCESDHIHKGEYCGLIEDARMKAMELLIEHV